VRARVLVIRVCIWMGVCDRKTAGAFTFSTFGALVLECSHLSTLAMQVSLLFSCSLVAPIDVHTHKAALLLEPRAPLLLCVCVCGGVECTFLSLFACPPLFCLLFPPLLFLSLLEEIEEPSNITTRSHAQESAREKHISMTYYHFLNCVLLTYAPLAIAYKCTSAYDRSIVVP
jgi:hypothetical protein